MTRSVLIIDDEPLMRLSMLDALKAEGYQVQEASNGEDGIQKIKASRYDLVITDLRMPGSDGLQVVRVCRECSAETEVIVITAHGSVDTAVQAMKLGAHDYVTKPFPMDELLMTVDRATKVQALRQENTALRQELEGKIQFRRHGRQKRADASALGQSQTGGHHGCDGVDFRGKRNGERSHCERHPSQQPALRPGPH